MNAVIEKKPMVLGPVEWVAVEQNTPEWMSARMGIPTASEFDVVMSTERVRGKGGRSTYMRKLVGERITGELSENFTNKHMERGHEMEQQARDLYAFQNGVLVHKVGFVKRTLNGRYIGASPDCRVSPGDGSIWKHKRLGEIKTKLPHLLIECFDDEGVLPAEHKAQVQGHMLVTDADQVDFIAYWPKMALFVVTVGRDETYIAEMQEKLDRFNEELDALEQRERNRL